MRLPKYPYTWKWRKYPFHHFPWFLLLSSMCVTRRLLIVSAVYGNVIRTQIIGSPNTDQDWSLARHHGHPIDSVSAKLKLVNGMVTMQFNPFVISYLIKAWSTEIVSTSNECLDVFISDYPSDDQNINWIWAPTQFHCGHRFGVVITHRISIWDNVSSTLEWRILCQSTIVTTCFSIWPTTTILITLKRVTLG